MKKSDAPLTRAAKREEVQKDWAPLHISQITALGKYKTKSRQATVPNCDMSRHANGARLEACCAK
jgi:hypothetical protein